jgi:hypothetical protein
MDETIETETELSIQVKSSRKGLVLVSFNGDPPMAFTVEDAEDFAGLLADAAKAASK